MENEKKERKEKEKNKKEKVQKEKKEREEKEKKEEEREGHPTLAALMQERLLGFMPSDEVGVPPVGLLPRLSAYQKAERAKIRPFHGSDPRRHGATTVCFNITIPLSAPFGFSGISDLSPGRIAPAVVMDLSPVFYTNLAVQILLSTNFSHTPHPPTPHPTPPP